MLLAIHKLRNYSLSNNFQSMFPKFPCSNFCFPPSTLQKSEENKTNFITGRLKEVNFIGNTFPIFTEPVNLQIGTNITITFTKKA